MNACRLILKVYDSLAIDAFSIDSCGIANDVIVVPLMLVNWWG